MVAKTKRTRVPESSAPSPSLRWSVERRLAFIDERLFWLGEVNRTDLVRRFGVSLAQASADFARYLRFAPRHVVYDKRSKRYVAEPGFSPVLAPPDAARFLGELRLVDSGLMAVEETVLGSPLPLDATPVPERPIDALVLRAVLGAIRKNLGMEMFYQSMSRPEPARRLIEPHALAHDGFRWHARAYDHETGTFRDFVLGRMSKPKLVGPASSDPTQDRDWQTTVRLEIAPHPGLTAAQAKAITLDYGIRGASSVIEVRRALLFYALRRLGLDVSPDTRPANEQHIVLANRHAIESLKAVRVES